MKVTLNLEEDGDIELDDGAGECAWMDVNLGGGCAGPGRWWHRP